MLRTIIFLILTLLTIPGHASKGKILTFNLHCFVEQWQERLSIFTNEIKEINPDIIALQEVCQNNNDLKPENMLKFLKAEFKKKKLSYPFVQTLYTHKAWDKDDEYLVVFTKKKPLKVEKGYLPKSYLKRGYIALKLKKFWFISTHLAYNDKQKLVREKQLQFLSKKFISRPSILSGDFNSSPYDNEQVYGLNGWGMSFFPGLSYPAKNPIKAIDGFWFSTPFVFKNAWAKLLFVKPYNELYLSDHYGVLLNVEY